MQTSSRLWEKFDSAEINPCRQSRIRDCADIGVCEFCSGANAEHCRERHGRDSFLRINVNTTKACAMRSGRNATPVRVARLKSSQLCAMSRMIPAATNADPSAANMTNAKLTRG